MKRFTIGFLEIAFLFSLSAVKIWFVTIRVAYGLPEICYTVMKMTTLTKEYEVASKLG